MQPEHPTHAALQSSEQRSLMWAECYSDSNAIA